MSNVLGVRSAETEAAKRDQRSVTVSELQEAWVFPFAAVKEVT